MMSLVEVRDGPVNLVVLTVGQTLQFYPDKQISLDKIFAYKGLPGSSPKSI
jgi:hypothetical protein